MGATYTKMSQWGLGLIVSSLGGEGAYASHTHIHTHTHKHTHTQLIAIIARFEVMVEQLPHLAFAKESTMLQFSLHASLS